MRFMMMIKSDEASESGAMPSEQLIEAMTKYNTALADAGALLAGEGLHPTSKGARIKFSRGVPTVTDGPFTEAKEVVAGYWIIQAKSRAEAIEWAKRVPFEAGESASSDPNGEGVLELRQIFELEEFAVGENESGWREKEAQWREHFSQSSAQGQGLKRFLIFRKADRDTEANVAPSEELLTAMGAYNDELIAKGAMLAGEGLHPSSNGVLIKYSRGKRRVIDGPFTEAKELIAGFTMIQAASKAEALAWAKKWPALDGNGEVELELRQVFGMDEFGPELTPELREAEERLRARVGGQQ